MTFRRLLTLLCLAILAAASLARGTMVWVCEGRVCSDDLARCCCAGTEVDAECDVAVPATESACRGGCGCEAKPVVAWVAADARVAPLQVSWGDAPFTSPAVAPPTLILPTSDRVEASPPPPDRSARLRFDPFACVQALRAPPIRLI